MCDLCAVVYEEKQEMMSVVFVIVLNCRQQKSVSVLSIPLELCLHEQQSPTLNKQQRLVYCLEGSAVGGTRKLGFYPCLLELGCGNYIGAQMSINLVF